MKVIASGAALYATTYNMAIPIYLVDCFVASLLAMTLFFKVAHYHFLETYNIEKDHQVPHKHRLFNNQTKTTLIIAIAAPMRAAYSVI